MQTGGVSGRVESAGITAGSQTDQGTFHATIFVAADESIFVTEYRKVSLALGPSAP
jgi:hypothetical protein